MNENKVIIYTASDGQTKIDVKLEDETLWLTQAQMCELYQTSRTNVVEHIKHIYEEGELTMEATCRKFRQVREEGGRKVEREMAFYNLDMIIALGYRVRSIIATRFRQWATLRLKEYMIKGFTLDDERLKKLGGGGYWKELLDRIRDIRATEKVMYRQVLEIYATSIDYDPRASVSQEFFKKVQNKIHYAIHGHTAAELIVERADAEKDFMGLLTFKGNHPTLVEAKTAKNYLNDKELQLHAFGGLYAPLHRHVLCRGHFRVAVQRELRRVQLSSEGGRPGPGGVAVLLQYGDLLAGDRCILARHWV